MPRPVQSVGVAVVLQDEFENTYTLPHAVTRPG
jgi:hypothetical protein